MARAIHPTPVEPKAKSSHFPWRLRYFQAYQSSASKGQKPRRHHEKALFSSKGSYIFYLTKSDSNPIACQQDDFVQAFKLTPGCCQIPNICFLAKPQTQWASQLQKRKGLAWPWRQFGNCWTKKTTACLKTGKPLKNIRIPDFAWTSLFASTDFWENVRILKGFQPLPKQINDKLHRCLDFCGSTKFCR